MDKIIEELLARVDAQYVELYDNLGDRECFSGWRVGCTDHGVIQLRTSGMWLCQSCARGEMDDVLGDLLQEYCELLDAEALA